jgi:G6PDH family F420-dependent oxidoreductase
MAGLGYTLMTEQADPRALVRFSEQAEAAGFDFAVCSDHYSPWLTSQGHAPYAWSVLGAVAHVTERMELMTYVTCPTIRYHPAVVAQKAATLGLMSDDRFTLGLGAGESLNEHVVGRGWPAATTRHEMLREAMEIIAALFDGGAVDYAGAHYRVDAARLWDLPDRRVPVGVAVSGPKSCERLAPLADLMISTEPDGQMCRHFDEAWTGSDTSRKVGQIPVSWDRDAEAAKARAHEQFRWFAGGWRVNADLPTTAAFAGATQYVTPDDVAASIPCGADVGQVVEAVSAFWEAGYTDVALVQIGGEHQEEFLRVAESELLPALRAGAPTG